MTSAKIHLYAGLEITAGQRTMSGLIVDLTGQTFVLPVMLTGQNSKFNRIETAHHGNPRSVHMVIFW